MNGIEPFAYLKATLEAIAGGHPASQIDGLLPRGIQHTANLTPPRCVRTAYAAIDRINRFRRRKAHQYDVVKKQASGS